MRRRATGTRSRGLLPRTRAQAFYRRNRFAPDGVTRTDDVGGHPLPELRMTR